MYTVRVHLAGGPHNGENPIIKIGDQLPACVDFQSLEEDIYFRYEFTSDHCLHKVIMYEYIGEVREEVLECDRMQILLEELKD